MVKIVENLSQKHEKSRCSRIRNPKNFEKFDDPGPLDGLSGKKTKNALKSALISKGLEPRITLDKKSLELLKEPSVRPIDRENIFRYRRISAL